jgi:hypothetical protein
MHGSTSIVQHHVKVIKAILCKLLIQDCMEFIHFQWSISTMCSIIFMLGSDAHMNAYQDT